jgi:hypothetical protein
MVKATFALLGRSPHDTVADCQSWQCRMSGCTLRTRRYSSAAPQKKPNLHTQQPRHQQLLHTHAQLKVKHTSFRHSKSNGAAPRKEPKLHKGWQGQQ